MRLNHRPESPFSSTFILLPTYMTDWDSPAVVLSEYCASFIHAKVQSSETDLYASVAYVNIVHVLFGLYT
jgi:hypothetical protein